MSTAGNARENRIHVYNDLSTISSRYRPVVLRDFTRVYTARRYYLIGKIRRTARRTRDRPG